MATPNWLPPLNSHNQCCVSIAFSPESPFYDRTLSSTAVFSVKTVVSVKFKSDDATSNQRTFEGLRCEEKFSFRCCAINSLSSFSTKIKNGMFPRMFIPFEFNKDILINGIRKFANSMRERTPKCYNVLPFELEMIKEVTIPDNELKAWNSWYDEKMLADPNFKNDYTRAISRPRTYEELSYERTLDLGFKAAVESCIDQLKTIILEDSKTESCCSICLEKLYVGSKATQLPCSHIFHGDCLVQWLEISHMCPLCRFELPFV